MFFDHLLDLSDLEKVINKSVETKEERDEIWSLVDEIVHHRVLESILDTLHKDHHEEFIMRMKKAPYDESIIEYLSLKVKRDIGEVIKQELGKLTYELLVDIKRA